MYLLITFFSRNDFKFCQLELTDLLFLRNNHEVSARELQDKFG